jgi:ABC-type transport system involved in cytochrome bd biosynthesis fused ATPase/permease subunit
MLVMLVLALGLVQALAMVGIAVGIRTSFAALQVPDRFPVWPIPLIIFAGVMLALARWHERKAGERLGQRYANEIRMQLFRVLAGVARSRQSQLTEHSQLQRLSGDMGAIRLWIGQGLLRVLVLSVRLGSLSVFLVWWMPVPLILGVLAFMALGLLVMYLLSTRLMMAHRRLRRARAGLTRFLAERLPHAQALRVAGRLARESRALDRQTQRLEQQAVDRQNLQGLMRSVPDAVRGLSVAWVLAVAMTLKMSAADTAACLAVVGLMIPGLRDLAGAWDKRAAWLVVKGRLKPLLETRDQAPARGGQPASHEPALAMNDPHAFQIDEVRCDGLFPIAAQLKPGQKVLLQSADRQARSRWLNAVAGLQPSPNAQPLLWHPHQPIDGPSITLVDEGSPLLGGSLRRAATFGSPRRPNDKRVLRVLQDLGLQDLVDRVGGLDGRLGWSGDGLSGEERQRLLLARAMLSTSDLVLLDDLGVDLTPDLQAALRRWLGRCRASVVLADTYAAAAHRGMTTWRLCWA